MKRLWVAAALAPLSLAATARAQTTISNGTTTPITTASSGNITIGSGGSVEPTMAGTATAQAAAVTLNSNNSVTNNGTIETQNLNYSTGILAVGGYTGSISNGGTIQINENTSAHTNGNNGINDGFKVNGVLIPQYALGTNRFGIEVVNNASGAPLFGTLTNSGAITIIGEDSAGIFIDTGGLSDSTGVGLNDTSTGAITVTGDNSFGIHSAGLITGNVTISGAITVTGQNSVGLALDKGATGAVDIGSSITVTAFRSTTAPVGAGLVNSLLPSQIEAGGPAVTIGGSVGNGISIDAPVAASAAGVTPVVTATTGGSITADGSAALLIGDTTGTAGAITIGAGPATTGAMGASLLIGGTVLSAGTYENFNALGVQIGSANGEAVNLPGGIVISGSVDANTVADVSTNPLLNATGNGTAIGLHLMSGVNLSTITVGAPLSTAGVLGASTTSTLNTTVTALQIDPGVSHGITLTNSGAITASVTGIAPVIGGAAAQGGNLGTATAISDTSGTITAINNTGSISATLTPIVPLQTASGITVALDQSHSVAGTSITITQTQAPTIPATSTLAAITPAAPSIVGEMLFGAGNVNLDIMAGTVTGAISLGSGTNTFDIENGATVTGNLTEAAGGVLGLTVGANGVNTATSILTMTSASHLALSNLTIGASGEAIFTVDPASADPLTKSSQFNVAGTANLDAGGKIGLNLISATPGVQTFTLITAGTLNSATSAQALLGTSSFLFNISLAETPGANGTVTATVSPRTAAQLGLNPSEAAAYTAIFDQLQSTTSSTGVSSNGVDAAVTADVLSKTNRSDFIHLYDQFLPDYEGGPFDTLVVGQGEIAQAEADTPIKLDDNTTRGWVQEIGYLDNRQDTASTNGYKAGGFGFIAGLERASGDSTIGVAGSFLTDGVRDDRQGPGALASSEAIEAGIYWRYGGDNGLRMHASVNGGYVYLSNDRLLFDEDTAGTVNLFREAKSQWNGATVSAEFGASYQVPVGRFYIRPEVIADYVYLYESAFDEHGGGPGEDLAVASRSSGEGAVQGDLVFGADLGGPNHVRPELTLGWRQVVSGGPGDTTARFLSGTGPSFTLTPQFQEHGTLVARVGVRAGSNFADFSADAGGQLSNTYQVYDARAVARFLF